MDKVPELRVILELETVLLKIILPKLVFKIFIEVKFVVSEPVILSLNIIELSALSAAILIAPPVLVISVVLFSNFTSDKLLDVIFTVPELFLIAEFVLFIKDESKIFKIPPLLVSEDVKPSNVALFIVNVCGVIPFNPTTIPSRLEDENV